MILNESMLRSAARDVYRNKTASEYLIESQNLEIEKKYDLFISHSFLDKDIIVGLSYYFNECGYRIYIDWIEDKDLDRECVTAKIANLLKQRIRQSEGLAYVATDNITNSKWCPWELGFADGMYGKACILPIMDTSFRGMEYLGLYPYLEYVESWVKKDFYVHFPYERAISLRDWLGIN